MLLHIDSLGSATVIMSFSYLSPSNAVALFVYCGRYWHVRLRCFPQPIGFEPDSVSTGSRKCNVLLVQRQQDLTTKGALHCAVGWGGSEEDCVCF